MRKRDSLERKMSFNMSTINAVLANSIAILLIIAITIQETEAIPYKSIELTFELRDREKQCFHEDLEVGTKAELDFQVIDGGDLDVDVSILAPSKTILYQESKRKWDTHDWNASETGQYTFCFGNEFSVYSHKLLFFELRLGEYQDGDDSEPLSDRPNYKASMDVMKFQMEAQTIQENYESILEAQTSHRLSEAQQRKRAQELNVRVMWWSAFETVSFVLIGILQVWAVKSFFSRHQGGYTLINN